MRNLHQNQLSLDLVFETRPNLKLKSPKPFLLSEKVKRILYRRGYSHIFNYPDYKYFKEAAKEIAYIDRAEAIADLFIENSNEVSDYSNYTY